MRGLSSEMRSGNAIGECYLGLDRGVAQRALDGEKDLRVLLAQLVGEPDRLLDVRLGAVGVRVEQSERAYSTGGDIPNARAIGCGTDAEGLYNPCNSSRVQTGRSRPGR
jgi:hypothetical protein